MKEKNNAVVIALSSAICLLPIILSLAVYKELPEQIAIHWDFTGAADSFAPKSIAAFGLPVLFAAINLFSKLRLYSDPKAANTSRAMRMFAEWTPPLLSVIIVPLTLFIAMGARIPIPLIGALLVGIVLIISGNYLPKSRQNYTIGIKLPWTLHNPDNWNKTHRLAGYMYVLGGLATIIGAFIFRSSIFWIFILAVIVIIVPVLYSYLLYTKTDKGGS